MAKHCDVCNRDYADDLATCPHCAEAKKTQLASRAEDRTTQLGENPPPDRLASDADIDLGHAPRSAPATGDAGAEPPSSGGSDIAWAALVEEPHDEVKIDAPSDRDLLKHEAEPPGDTVRPRSDSIVDLGASPNNGGEDVSDSAVGSGPISGSQVFMAELASDASRVDFVGDSGMNLGTQDVASGSPPSGGAASSRDLIAEAVEAGIDQGTPAAELTEEAALDVVEAEENSSAVDLGASPPAEEVVEVEEADVVEAMGEGEVNLEGLAVPEPAGSGSHLTSDSAVDLGSHAEMAALGSPTDEAPTMSSEGSGINVGDAPASALSPSVSDMDLDLDAQEAESLSAEPATNATGDEPAVSESEVNALLANLEETPDSVGDLSAAVAEERADAAEGEAAVAAAEQEVAAEEEAAAAAREEEKPIKSAKPRSRVPALAGSALLGVLVGAGALTAARFAGVDVPAMVGAGEKLKQTTMPVVAQPQPVPQAPTFQSRADMVRRGDWDEAAKAGIEQIEETKPEELAARGSYRLGAYLAKSGAKINLQDPALQLAVADLNRAAEAKNPDALYDLGLINELANKLPEARAEYTKGVQAFQNDPVQKRRFQSALQRVELKTSGGERGAFCPLPERVEDRAALLALLLIGLQQPQSEAQPAPQAQAGGEEAGYDFWEAAKLARDGKFADAMRTIDKARKLHDQRRFTRLRKAQNPLSDPTEDIFLRCCDELKNYWALESHLRDGGYLTNKNTPLDALQDALKKADAGAALIKGTADKLIAEKLIARPEDLPKGLDRLIADRKAAEGKLGEMTAQLKKAQDDAKTLAGQLATAEKAIKDRNSLLMAVVEREKILKAANDEMKATFQKVADDLAAAQFIDPKGKTDFGAAVRQAVEVAKMKDPDGTIRKQRSAIDRLTAALKLRWSPEEMMPLWLTLLEQNRARPELANMAEKDAQRVAAEARTNPARRGEAEIVRGLALRNTEKFPAARAALQAGRAAVDKTEWLAAADAALKEVSDPAAYYAGQAENLYNRGRMNAALDLLGRALNLLPEKERGRLLARRGLIELDAALSKAKGVLPPSEPLLIAARRDADAAAKSGAAEGHYAAGRIAEALGQADAAIQSYRLALTAHPALDADGSRYRIALARVLSQSGEIRPGPAMRAPAANKVGWIDPAPYPARYRAEAKLFLLASVLGLQAPGLLDDTSGMEEAERLADEILKAPAGQVPFDVRSQALAVKGRWTLALQSYIEGVRPFLPREYGKGLMYLVINHPRLKRPDSLRITNPMEAEKHFAAGLNFYFDRDYANAEKEFLSTVENDSNDARFFYYLGLSRLAQNKRRDANDDFDQGAMLERLNRPAPAAVSESLERIQGPMRRIINDIRYRPDR